MPDYINPGAAAANGLLDFLAQRELAQRQAIADRILQEDRARRLAREDTLDRREDLVFEQGQRDRAAAAEAAAAAAKKAGAVDSLQAMRQASLNVAGSDNPTGAQATRDTIAVALRLAGAGKEADAGRKEDAATASAAAQAEALQAWADGDADTREQLAPVIEAKFGVKLPRAPKRDVRSVDGALVEVGADGGVRTLYQAPAKGPSEATQLTNEIRRTQLEERQAKLEEAAGAKTQKEAEARSATQTALDSVDRLLTHPGIGKATGAYELRGFTQEAQDFNAERDMLVAALTLPNLGALKGPMSDKDVVFVKQLATKLANTKMSAEATRAELQRAREFLRGKLASQGGAPRETGGGRDLGKDW